MGNVTPGQALALPAREWNTSVEVNDLYRRGLLARPASVPSAEFDSNHLEVRNDTGGDLARWAIVGLGDPLFSPADNLAEFFRAVVVSGETPTLADHLGKWALLLEPIPAGKIGRAVAAGMWPTLLRVDSAHHDRADIADGETDLASNYYGSAEILWKEDGTGPLRAVIRLSGWAAPRIKAVAQVQIAPGASGQVEVWRAGAATGDFLDAWLDWETSGTPIDANTELEIAFHRDKPRWWISNADCRGTTTPGAYA